MREVHLLVLHVGCAAVTQLATSWQLRIESFVARCRTRRCPRSYTVAVRYDCGGRGGGRDRRGVREGGGSEEAERRDREDRSWMERSIHCRESVDPYGKSDVSQRRLTWPITSFPGERERNMLLGRSVRTSSRRGKRVPSWGGLSSRQFGLREVAHVVKPGSASLRCSFLVSDVAF